MTVGYVVSEIGYDYNDEIYHQSENGGGTPVKVYLDYQKAKEQVDSLNLKELLTCEIGQYAYDMEDIIDDMHELSQIVHQYNPNIDVEDSYEFGEWFSKNASSFSQEDQSKLVNLVRLKFYEITKVEIDDAVVDQKDNSGSSRFKV